MPLPPFHPPSGSTTTTTPLPKPTTSALLFFNSQKLNKKSQKFLLQSTSCSFHTMNQMEVEVKLRLPNASAHQKVLSLLSPFKTATHNQRNTFFDGSSNELSSRRAILRLRFYETPTEKPKCVICLKAKAVIVDGVSRVEEDEEEVDSTIAYECVEEPDRLMGFDSRIVRRVKEEFGVNGFLGLGGFRNVRNVCEWNGVKLEVDETIYEFGTCYEIECESEEPEKVKGMIEDFLKENEVEYSYSEKSKFAIFRSGKLP